MCVCVQPLVSLTHVASVNREAFTGRTNPLSARNPEGGAEAQNGVCVCVCVGGFGGGYDG